MEPLIVKDSYVTIYKKNDNIIEIGDIIFYVKNNNFATIHRVVSILEIDGKKYYRTKGDNNEFKDRYLVAYDEVLGLVLK